MNTTQDELLATDELVIALKPAHKLMVTANTPDGKPIESAEVSLSAEYGPLSVLGSRKTTDAAGKAEFYVYENGI